MRGAQLSCRCRFGILTRSGRTRGVRAITTWVLLQRIAPVSQLRFISLSLVAACTLVACGGGEPASTPVANVPAATAPTTPVALDKNAYPVFPDADAGADPAVPADQGGRGFTGEGWETNTDYELIGDPRAVKGGAFRERDASVPRDTENRRARGEYDIQFHDGRHGLRDLARRSTRPISTSYPRSRRTGRSPRTAARIGFASIPTRAGPTASRSRPTTSSPRGASTWTKGSRRRCRSSCTRSSTGPCREQVHRERPEPSRELAQLPVLRRFDGHLAGPHIEGRRRREVSRGIQLQAAARHGALSRRRSRRRQGQQRHDSPPHRLLGGQCPAQRRASTTSTRSARSSCATASSRSRCSRKATSTATSSTSRANGSRSSNFDRVQRGLIQKRKIYNDDAERRRGPCLQHAQGAIQRLARPQGSHAAPEPPTVHREFVFQGVRATELLLQRRPLREPE